MKLSAPTRVVFLISLALAIFGALPHFGIFYTGLGLYAYWALPLAYVVLAASVLLKKV